MRRLTPSMNMDGTFVRVIMSCMPSNQTRMDEAQKFQGEGRSSRERVHSSLLDVERKPLYICATDGERTHLHLIVSKG